MMVRNVSKEVASDRAKSINSTQPTRGAKVHFVKMIEEMEQGKSKRKKNCLRCVPIDSICRWKTPGKMPKRKFSIALWRCTVNYWERSYMLIQFSVWRCVAFWFVTFLGIRSPHNLQNSKQLVGPDYIYSDA
jgi:hypothetical protein